MLKSYKSQLSRITTVCYPYVLYKELICFMHVLYMAQCVWLLYSHFFLTVVQDFLPYIDRHSATKMLSLLSTYKPSNTNNNTKTVALSYLEFTLFCWGRGMESTTVVGWSGFNIVQWGDLDLTLFSGLILSSNCSMDWSGVHKVQWVV